MKTSKKLLSLLLVAIMLVAAIPFQAFAAGYTFTVVVEGYEFEMPDSDGTVTADELAYFLGEGDPLDAATMAKINALCPWTVAKGSKIVISGGSAQPVPPVEEPPVEEPAPAEKFDVSINVFKGADTDEYDFKHADKYDSISYAQIIALAGAGADVTVTYNMGGVNGQVLTAGGSITVTADCFVWVRPNAATQPETPPAVEPENPPVVEPETPSSYTISLDLAEGNTEPGYIRKYTVVEGQRLSFLDDFKYMDRSGMDFVRWVYTANGKTATANDLYDPANGTTIKAVWDLDTYFLTLDENRQGEEYVNYGTRIALGDDLWAAVNKFDKPQRRGYVFMGWSLNGKIIKPGDTYQYPGSATAYAVWELSTASGWPVPPQKDGKVYLEIYLNGRYGELAKRVDITSYAADYKITRAEVKSIVEKYYGPKAGQKLYYDGLFDEEGWWWYTRDRETDGEEYIVVNRYDDQYVFVMVKNVRVSHADPSNPKTGDYVLTTALTLMAVSGLTAAAVYVTGKKRKV